MSRASDDETRERGGLKFLPQPQVPRQPGYYPEISTGVRMHITGCPPNCGVHRQAHVQKGVHQQCPQAGACTKGGTPVSTGLRMHIGSVMGVKLYRHRELYRHQRFPKERNRVRSRGRRTVRFPNPLPV